MHDITSTLPVGVRPSARWYAQWPSHVNRRRAPGVIWLGFTGYGFIHQVHCSYCFIHQVCHWWLSLSAGSMEWCWEPPSSPRQPLPQSSRVRRVFLVTCYLFIYIMAWQAEKVDLISIDNHQSSVLKPFTGASLFLFNAIFWPVVQWFCFTKKCLKRSYYILKWIREMILYFVRAASQQMHT